MPVHHELKPQAEPASQPTNQPTSQPTNQPTNQWQQKSLTKSNPVQHSPREGTRCSANQEIPRILWNRKVHCRTHNSPPLVPIMSHINPVHVFNKISWIFTLLLSSQLCLGLQSNFLSLRLPTKTLYAPPLSPIKTTRYVNLILLDLSPEYLVNSTDHKVSRYAVFSIPLLPRPS